VDHAKRYPHVAEAIGRMRPRTLVLNGELAVFGQQLRSRFDWLRDRQLAEIATPSTLRVLDLRFSVDFAVPRPLASQSGADHRTARSSLTPRRDLRFEEVPDHDPRFDVPPFATAILVLTWTVLTLGAEAAPLSPGDVLVADQGGFVYHYSATGADLGRFVSDLSSPSWLTVDRSANVYVVEYGGARVRKYSPLGVLLLTITTSYTPGGIAVGSDGSIYIAHYDGGRIHRYSAAGDDLGVFAS
jgi:hypothetical protein